MKSVLITGADGYLGGRLVRKLLTESKLPVVAWVRSRSAEEFAAKRRALEKRLGELAGNERLQFATGDLRDAEPFRQVDTDSVGRIVHGASVTSFNVEREVATEVNLGGAIKLCELAEKCPNLEKLIYVSTVYASGMREGVIAESPLEETPFANFYEWSKWQSEQALLSRFSTLPWAIARVATVIADNDDGWFHTGDIGYLDRDGFLWITGRKKNLIVLPGGKKVWPEEVEEAISASPLIAEICVLGVKSADVTGTEGERVVAVVRPDPARPAISEDRLSEEVKAHVITLATFKRPSRIVVYPREFPKTATRKVKRNALLEQLKKEKYL